LVLGSWRTAEGLLGAKGNRAARRRFALLQRIEGLNQKAQGSKALGFFRYRTRVLWQVKTPGSDDDHRLCLLFALILIHD
jgi:hypothetical protein